jgi:hypothetical protein
MRSALFRFVFCLVSGLAYQLCMGDMGILRKSQFLRRMLRLIITKSIMRVSQCCRWNLHLLTTTHFGLAPESAGGAFVPGEGHAYLYIDGEQGARVYGPWLHVDKLPYGLVDATVTLNANDHSQLAVGDAPLSATKQVQCQ